MQELDQILNRLPPFATVMIASTAEHANRLLLDRLVSAGANVIGPVGCASVALALAAQSAVDVAIVTPSLEDARSGHELAQTLEQRWGVRTVVTPLEF